MELWYDPASGAQARAAAPGVFILSDVRLYREGLAISLESRGELRVLGASAPRDLDLAELGRSEVAILLLDATMAVCLDLVRRLKLEAPQVKVLAVSVNDTDDDWMTHIEAGVAGCVPRDGSVDEVVETALRCMRGEAPCSGRLAAKLFDRVAALAEAARPAVEPPHLTRREFEVLCLADDGLSNKEIARALSIGLPTVKNHIHRTLEKLGVRRRAEAAAWLRAQLGPGGRAAEPRSVLPTGRSPSIGPAQLGS
jgi:DNA-binding NarL/FixJ family response regulator